MIGKQRRRSHRSCRCDDLGEDEALAPTPARWGKSEIVADWKTLEHVNRIDVVGLVLDPKSTNTVYLVDLDLETGGRIRCKTKSGGKDSEGERVRRFWLKKKTEKSQRSSRRPARPRRSSPSPSPETVLEDLGAISAEKD
ncbi:hypothetical protein U1Q18_004905 [Sarracenia purpurea var. burkii]